MNVPGRSVMLDEIRSGDLIYDTCARTFTLILEISRSSIVDPDGHVSWIELWVEGSPMRDYRVVVSSHVPIANSKVFSEKSEIVARDQLSMLDVSLAVAKEKAVTR